MGDHYLLNLSPQELLEHFANLDRLNKPMEKSIPEWLRLSTLGGIIQEYKLPTGLNIVLGFPKDELYKKYPDPYFGQTIGRVANRISGAQIKDLNGRSYKLFANNGPNCLHGGKVGWGLKDWQVTHISKEDANERVEVVMVHTSEDGDEGFPGKVDVTLWYRTWTEKGPVGELVHVLETEYEAVLADSTKTGIFQSKPDIVEQTVVAMTNHSYFNLSGEATISGTKITLSTNQHLPVDDTSIPLGDIEAYPGINANEAFTLGPEDPDIDHCFILDTDPSGIPIDTRSRPMKLLAASHHPTSKAHLEVYSTEPAFQFYTGRYIDIPAVTDEQGNIITPKREARAGFCVEPSRYVNAINMPEWKKMVTLNRGEKYGSKTMYRCWAD